MTAKILYLSYDGLTDPLGQSQILPYLEGLSKKGYLFSVVSFEKDYNTSAQANLKERMNAGGIRWYALRYTKRPPVLSTVYDILRLRRLAFALHQQNEFDIVHCRSYITSLVGLALKRKTDVNFIFDMRGFWADERIDGNIWSPKNPLYKIIYKYFKRKEVSFLTESDHIVSLTKAGKRVIQEDLCAGLKTPITVIPCCVDNSHFDPSKTKKQRDKLRATLRISNEQRVLGYVGSIGTWYMLPEMVGFFKKLIERVPNFIFLFVTKEQSRQIEYIFEEANVDLNHVRIVGATREQVPTYISIMDWSVFFIKPRFSKKASSPTKQGEVMSMGKPIICNAGVGDSDEILKKYGGGIAVQDFSDPEYTSAVEFILTSKFDSKEIRAGSIDYFGLEKGVTSYEAIYQDCLEASRLVQG